MVVGAGVVGLGGMRKRDFSTLISHILVNFQQTLFS
jgi:hypothetical protein